MWVLHCTKQVPEFLQRPLFKKGKLLAVGRWLLAFGCWQKSNLNYSKPSKLS
jgi:hypothetical protein